MSVLYVGAYSFSRSYSSSTNSHSTCGATNASVVTVHISDSNCSHCSASTSGGLSYGANTYGGSISAAYIGAFAYSFAFRGDLHYFSNSSVETTHVETLSITINNATINNSQAISGERCCPQCMNLNANKLTWVDNLDSASEKNKGLTRESFGANVSYLPLSVFKFDRNIIRITNSIVLYFSQVYGGAISVMVGSYVRSSIQIGDSNSTCGDTICLNCSINVTGTSISNSEALSSTSGNFAATRLAPHSSGSAHRVAYCVEHKPYQRCALTLFSGDSNGAFVRADSCE